jgi:hypothetical protein
MNRYYAAQWRRFTTPTLQASAQLAHPQSRNRYSYVENDRDDGARLLLAGDDEFSWISRMKFCLRAWGLRLRGTGGVLAPKAHPGVASGKQAPSASLCQLETYQFVDWHLR